MWQKHLVSLIHGNLVEMEELERLMILCNMWNVCKICEKGGPLFTTHSFSNYNLY